MLLVSEGAFEAPGRVVREVYYTFKVRSCTHVRPEPSVLFLSILERGGGMENMRNRLNIPISRKAEYECLLM